MVEIKSGALQLGVGRWQLERGRRNGVKIYSGAKIEASGPEFDMGGERKRSVKDDATGSFLKSLADDGAIVCDKGDGEGASGREGLVSDMSIEMPGRRPNGCVKWAIG